MPFNVKLPDGRILENVPDGTTKEQIAAKLGIKSPSALGSGIRGVGQGATLNLSDELQAGIGALVAAPFVKDRTMGQLYNEGLKSQREQLQADLTTNPTSTVAGNIAGGVALTGVGASALKSTAPNIAKGITNYAALNPVKAGAAIGAGQGAAYGFGGGEGGVMNRLGDAAKGGAIGGVIGAATGQLTKTLTSKKPNIPTSDEIRAQASDAYKLADEKGGVLKGWFTNRFADEIKDIQPATVAGQKVPTDPKLTEALDFINQFKGKRLTLQDAQNLDEYLGDTIDNFSELGRLNKSGQKLYKAQTTLRKMIDSADETLIEGGKEGFDALKQGRLLWKTQAKLRDIEKIITRAELSEQPATAIKSGFRTLLSNPERLKGFSKAEQAAIKKAATTGIITDALRSFGSRLIPIITTASGTGGVGGALASQGASIASRNMASALQLDKARQLANLVATQGKPILQRTNPMLTTGGASIGGILGGTYGNQ